MRNKISVVFLVSAFLSAFVAPHAEAVVDINPPDCSFDATTGRGTATDDRLGEDTNDNGVLNPGEDLNDNGELDRDTGIDSVVLNPGSTNLNPPTLDSFVPPQGIVHYTVTATDPTTAGTGVITATDGAGNPCPVDVQIPPQQPNVPPNADAGPDQNTVVLTLVTLNGSGSNDPDNDPLTFQWTFVSPPAGSALTNSDIADATTATASFTPDVPGEYQLRLEVSDGEGTDSDEVVVTAQPVPQPNVPPNAAAGPDQNAVVLTLVTLNGSGSNDPDNGPNPLTFQWTFVSTPVGSTLTNSDITDATTATASFIPDVLGDYLLRLDVSDGEDTASDQVVVTVQPPPPIPPDAPPTASNVLISGTAEVGQVLTASYDYADAENDPQGASTFRWLHTDGEVDTPIDGATDRTYTLVAADEGALIRFEVTPVALSGRSPGLPANAVVGPVVIPGPDLATPPTASDVLIAGTPQVGQVLTGSYTYADAEGNLQGTSIFRWLRNNVAIAGATARSYALVAADEGTLIRFEVTPVAQSGPSPGLAMTSAEVEPVTPAPNDGPTASDLELISLTGTPELLTVNGQLTYTITVRNNGPAAATGVHVIDALPPGATPVPAEGPADSSQGQCTGTPSSGPPPQALTVDCDLETLAPDAEATVTINVMPTVPGDLINTAQVAAFEIDPNPANNTKTETTPIRLPDPADADLAITATVGPRVSGQGFTYTLTVENHGPATATRVQLTNDLPRDIALERIIPSQGSCGDTDPVLCDLGALATRAAATVTIDVIRTGVDPDTLPNRAAVNGDQHDPNTANNFALTNALDLVTPRTTCNSTRCTLRLTCNRSDLLERRCDNQVTLFVDTRARRETRARRLSDERAVRPPGVRFAGASSNIPGGQKNVRLKVTPKGKQLARTLIRQGKKKLKGMMEISNHMGGKGTDRIRVTVRLK